MIISELKPLEDLEKALAEFDRLFLVGCAACATLCPTNALVWDAGVASHNGHARLRLNPSRCQGCGVCRDICDVGAIEITFRPGLRLKEDILFSEEACGECARTFLSSGRPVGLCPGCRIRHRLFHRAADSPRGDKGPNIKTARDHP